MTKVLILTGPIASGKSTVRKLFDSFGIPVLDADAVVHRAYTEPTHKIYRAVLSLLGPSILDENNNISRPHIRNMVSTVEELTALEKTVSPLVRDELESWTANQSTPYVVWEVPLYRKGWFDSATVLSVITDPARQKELFLTRKHSTLEAFELIKSVQQSADEYKQLSDVVIENSGTLEELSEKVKAVHLQMIGV